MEYITIWAPLATSVAIVWISLRTDYLKFAKNRNFELSQSVYIEFFSGIYTFNKLLKAIFSDLWVTSNSVNVQELNQVINNFDKYKIESRFALFGDDELIALVEEWAEDKNAFLAGFDLIRSKQFNFSDKEKQKFQDEMEKSLSSCYRLEKAIKDKILKLMRH